jgi:hypothetical protein
MKTLGFFPPAACGGEAFTYGGFACALRPFFFAVLFLRVRIKSYARFGMTLETAGIRNG